jgi:chromosome partitioning protein
MQTIAIANVKGGTAKTTTTAALGAMLAEAGRRVLLVDLDPQASLTQALGISAPGRSLVDVIGGTQPGTLSLENVVQPIRDNLAIVPSSIDLSDSELGLAQRWGKETALKATLASVTGYDVTLIDCPPSLGLLTLNGLTAAEGVIVPTLPAAADLRGVRLFLDTINRIKRDGRNPGLDLIGILVVQYDGRLIAHNQALDALQSAGLKILAVIPRSVRVQEAAAALLPLIYYDPKGKPSEAYKQLFQEVKRWLKRHSHA